MVGLGHSPWSNVHLCSPDQVDAQAITQVRCIGQCILCTGLTLKRAFPLATNPTLFLVASSRQRYRTSWYFLPATKDSSGANVEVDSHTQRVSVLDPVEDEPATPDSYQGHFMPFYWISQDFHLAVLSGSSLRIILGPASASKIVFLHRLSRRATTAIANLDRIMRLQIECAPCTWNSQAWKVFSSYEPHFISFRLSSH